MQPIVPPPAAAANASACWPLQTSPTLSFSS
uniref:Uncharacterized protein n=1 Tax=Rhizophora mucronata TaxID=61149 RepID=A0A2P2Q972_RHIMU